MQGFKTILVSVCLIALATSAWSQSTSTSQRTVPPQIDPRTGEFRLLQPQFEIDPNVATTLTGTFVVNFTITVKSVLPATDVISCGVSTQVIDGLASGFIIEETATVAATRSGSTAKCTVTIPYSWSLTSASTDMVLVSFQILAPGTTAGSQLPSRDSLHGFANIHVPATGITTTFTLTPTI